MTIATRSTTTSVQYLSFGDRIPSRLSVFAQQKDTGTPISKMTCFAEVELEIIVRSESSDGPRDSKASQIIPLGMLATDHIGYLSFDLSSVSKLKENLKENLDAFIGNDRLAFEYSINTRHIWVYPMGKTDRVVDALEIGRISSEVIVVRLEIEKPEIEDDLRRVSLLSMQNPSLIDWRISPSSFAINPQGLIGEEGCESLLPSNYAVQEFYFKQLVRYSGKAVSQPNSEVQAHLGYVFEYKTAWYPIGHSLGQIVYSLPLAPGESINIAVIDWARKSSDLRIEDLSVKEQLLHNQQRDRSITEAVRASLDEWQKGSSTIGGASTSGGVNLGIASFGASGAVGGSTSSTSGTRELASNTIQTISDGFVQASSALRELHSTVVVQSSQQEKEVIQTRTVTNYNHSHAMTMLYYEVLRHYRIATELVRRQPVLLVQYKVKNFSRVVSIEEDIEEKILDQRRVLEQVLLDERFKSGFDAAERLNYDYPAPSFPSLPPSPPSPPSNVTKFVVRVKIGNDGVDQALNASQMDGGMFFQVLLTDGSVLRWRLVDFSIKFIGRINDDLFRVFAEETTNTFTIDTYPKVNVNIPGIDLVPIPDLGFVLGSPFSKLLSQVKQVGLYWQRVGTDKPAIQGFQVMAVINDSSIIVLHDSLEQQNVNIKFNDDGDLWGPLLSQSPPPPAPLPSPEAIELENRRSQDEATVSRLLDHLNANKMYYHRALWLLEDANERAMRFSDIDISLGNNTAISLLDSIENRPLEVIGNYVAFALNPDLVKEIQKLTEFKEEEERPIYPEERLATLPTRGVFAEAKLGHCNASEEIDNTRFWKWEEHSIPFAAPGINPVTPVTPQPQQVNTQPSQLPNSVVNIVNPPSAPDPTGLSEALKVLATPNIFRDMSGREEVANLLKSLSNNSISIAEAANKAREIQNKYGENLDKQQKDYDLGIYKATSDLIGKAIEADAKQAAEANTRKEEANAKKAEVEAVNVQTEAAKNIPPSMRKPVYQDAANTLAGNPKKEKVVVFKAIGFNNQTIDGVFKLAVRDVVAQTDVITESKIGSYYDKSVVFKSPEPVLEARVAREETISIKILDETINLPQINIVPKNNSYSVGKSHRVINITLMQESRTVTFKAKSTDSAVNQLMDKWGGELGIKKVVAAKLVADYEQKKEIAHTTEEEKSYSFNVPTSNYDLVIASK